jgi:bifunctional UDP-N-acetylglucosamine pyrophosphorylase/glucosamine-1-phosphate N-acetyltransferase
VLILCGDTPALDAETLRGLIAAHRASEAALTVLTFTLADPTGYGRIVRGGDGRVARIVEHRDASEAERRIAEVNAGIYVVEREVLLDAIERIGSDNAQGEVYLTDVVELTAAAGRAVEAHRLDEPWRVSGINTRVQLAELEEAMLTERRRLLMESGVTLQAPETIRIEGAVEIGRDTVIGPGVQLLGGTRLGAGVRVDAGCVLRDVVIDEGAHLLPYVVAEQTHIGPKATAGPFTHLRPGTVLGVGAKAGNFVELKKAVIGDGSKVNHLSYLGDCAVGHRVNVGAGTITCNYDGTHKHRTIIEDEVFIGSDTQLVAPVRLGRRSTVAAGTTVTRDVPEGALVLSRVAQTVHEGYDERHRRPREAQKRSHGTPDET